ncbi:MAG TPA: ATP-dependent RecD-like DNA helicase [Nitrospiraceae bacterium]|nr:ATP-dependent RecD-like DNA helicase [Nitrospiraceae bacterium]
MKTKVDLIQVEGIEPAPTKSELSMVAWIALYLSSKLFKGIGPILANKIIATFGVKTVEIIEKSIDKLKKIRGIGKKRIQVIQTNWQSEHILREAVLFLQELSIGATFILRIIDYYGRNTVEALKENPFRLIRDIKGMKFLQADRIAQRFGVPLDSKLRIQEGIFSLLSRTKEQGHTYQPYYLLMKRCIELLSLKGNVIANVLHDLESEQILIMESLGSGKAIYLRHLYMAETEAAKHLTRILKGRKSVHKIDIDCTLKIIARDMGITLEGEQYEAVKEAVTKKVLIITGGPGVGKSTVIKAIIKMYEHIGRQVILAAPTGRAAKRITEITGHEASTIHRLLEFGPDGMFKRNEHNRLKGEVLIVDEFSMVDIALLHNLLRAIPTNTNLIIVGDPDQLPSVGPGNVLRDLLASNKVPAIKLVNIYRQSEGSLIIDNAHRVNEGEMIITNAEHSETSDFLFFEVLDPEEIVERIIGLCKELFPKCGFNPLTDVQILSPMNKGCIGTRILNPALQSSLNTSQEKIDNNGYCFRQGDKVMQRINNYEKGVFNGDMGVVQSIEMTSKAINVDFEGKLITYTTREHGELQMAYAVSIHKSQGSEYPAVIIPMHLSQGIMLQRNLLYTGITRAKKMVAIVGSSTAIKNAVNNDRSSRRYSRLKERMQTKV